MTLVPSGSLAMLPSSRTPTSKYQCEEGMKDRNGCGAPSMRLEDTGVLTEDKDAGGLTQEV